MEVVAAGLFVLVLLATLGWGISDSPIGVLKSLFSLIGNIVTPTYLAFVTGLWPFYIYASFIAFTFAVIVFYSIKEAKEDANEESH